MSFDRKSFFGVTTAVAFAAQFSAAHAALAPERSILDGSQTTYKRIDALLASPRMICALDLRFFSEKELHFINDRLGAMKDWLSVHKLYDPTLAEDYLLTGGPTNVNDAPALLDQYLQFFKLNEAYKAGKPEGFSFLAKRSLEINEIVYAFASHFLLMKEHMFSAKAEKLFDRTFGKDLVRLTDMTDENTRFYLRRVEAGCTLPKPVFERTR